MELACTLCGADAGRDISRQSLGVDLKSRRIIIFHSILKLPLAKCLKYLEEEESAASFCSACDILVENGLQLLGKLEEIKGQLSVVRDKLLTKVKVGANGQGSWITKDQDLGAERRAESDGVGLINGISSLSNLVNFDEGTGLEAEVGVDDSPVDEMGGPEIKKEPLDYNFEVAEHCQCVISPENGQIFPLKFEHGAEGELGDVGRSLTPSEVGMDLEDDWTPPPPPKPAKLKTLAQPKVQFRPGPGRPPGPNYDKTELRRPKRSYKEKTYFVWKLNDEDWKPPKHIKRMRKAPKDTT